MMAHRMTVRSMGPRLSSVHLTEVGRNQTCERGRASNRRGSDPRDNHLSVPSVVPSI